MLQGGAANWLTVRAVLKAETRGNENSVTWLPTAKVLFLKSLKLAFFIEKLFDLRNQQIWDVAADYSGLLGS